MDIYEKLKAWVEQSLRQADIDRLLHDPGQVAIFPQGIQERKSRQDVLGNRYRTLRYPFWLRLVLPPGDAAAKLVLGLQADAHKAGFCVDGGSMKKSGSDGLVVYEIRLFAEREEFA